MSFTELPLLLALLLAHLCGDFLLQPLKWVEERFKRHWRSKWLYVHAFIHALLSLIALSLLLPLSGWLLLAALVIGVTHLVTDLAKSYMDRDKLVWFVADQMIHVLVIVIVWLVMTHQQHLIHGVWELLLNEKILLIMAAYILAIWPFAIVIEILCKKWTHELKLDKDSLPDGGRRIGQIERFLILTFILVDQFAAIGFLLAAKSILRLGDSKEDNHRKINEYILLGTLLSFSLTIALGLVVVRLLHLV